jgi:hypothetical protein
VNNPLCKGYIPVSLNIIGGFRNEGQRIYKRRDCNTEQENTLPDGQKECIEKKTED